MSIQSRNAAAFLMFQILEIDTLTLGVGWSENKTVKIDSESYTSLLYCLKSDDVNEND